MAQLARFAPWEGVRKNRVLTIYSFSPFLSLDAPYNLARYYLALLSI